MLTAFNGILLEEANRLDGDLYERSLHVSGWIDLIDTGAFPEGIGDIVSTMIYERTLPASTPVWKNLMGADGNAGADVILPPVQTISTAKTLREYRLQTTALESDTLNVNDLRTAVIREEQLTAMRDNLSMNTNYLWAQRARSEYHAAVNKVNLLSTGNTEAATDPTAESDQALSNSALQRYYLRMIRMGANKRPLDQMNGKPIFGLMLDPEVSDALRSEVAISEALKYDGRANELLSPLGVDKAYKNFFHICDVVAPRFTFGGGVYTEVLPYTLQAEDTANGKFGARQVENPDYETATHTVTYVFHQDVIKLLYPNSTTGSAAGVKFDPVMYRGDWKWLNVINIDPDSSVYNPDGTLGKFRGVFAAATKVVVKEFGFAIFHRRPGF